MLLLDWDDRRGADDVDPSRFQTPSQVSPVHMISFILSVAKETRKTSEHKFSIQVCTAYTYFK